MLSVLKELLLYVRVSRKWWLLPLLLVLLALGGLLLLAQGSAIGPFIYTIF